VSKLKIIPQNKDAERFIFLWLSLGPTTEEACPTHAPIQALVCPHRNAFGHARFGRASLRVLYIEITSFVVDSSRSRKSVVKFVWSHAFFWNNWIESKPSAWHKCDYLTVSRQSESVRGKIANKGASKLSPASRWNDQVGYLVYSAATRNVMRPSNGTDLS
jgi:hypothetical protein